MALASAVLSRSDTGLETLPAGPPPRTRDLSGPPIRSGASGLAGPSASAGMGFPVGAVIAGATQVASAVVPLFTESPAERQAEQIEDRRRWQAGRALIQSDLKNLETELEDMGESEARDVLAQDAAEEYERIRREYQTRLQNEGVPDATLLAQQGAEAARGVYLSAAERVAFYSQWPLLVAGLGATVALGVGIYYLSTSDESD